MTTLQWHSFGVAAKYTIGPWKFFGGYEYIDLADPNNPLVPGAWLPLTPQPDIDDVARRAKYRKSGSPRTAKKRSGLACRNGYQGRRVKPLIRARAAFRL
jgi:hypothetical protein